MDKKELLKLLTKARDFLADVLYGHEMEYGDPFTREETKGSPIDLFVDKLDKIIEQENKK